ncbi:ASCH domain-containing protein [Halobacillus litoralis]|uniref:ASCH domain-containing protein n=1 Tax=Halobacillus litoralis TaxID=45668 RepID=UPI001CD3464B|nr:ASCH domain-containing protein [Halobacillus litoralis]MCA0969210.1 ASCH domain-containing protein [Halobacillus litoralis]
MKGLIIKSPWIDYILDGRKTWEIRGMNTKTRGTIGLIKSGTGHVYGEVDLVGSRPLSLDSYKESHAFHCVEREHCEELPYKHTHAWIFENPRLYSEPIAYEHPMGAVIWVKSI